MLLVLCLSELQPKCGKDENPTVFTATFLCFNPGPALLSAPGLQVVYFTLGEPASPLVWIWYTSVDASVSSCDPRVTPWCRAQGSVGARPAGAGLPAPLMTLMTCEVLKLFHKVLYLLISVWTKIAVLVRPVIIDLNRSREMSSPRLTCVFNCTSHLYIYLWTRLRYPLRQSARSRGGRRWIQFVMLS